MGIILNPNLYMSALMMMNVFSVEGGNDKSTSDFYNPLYISDDPFGGYAKLSNDEREVREYFLVYGKFDGFHFYFLHL